MTIFDLYNDIPTKIQEQIEKILDAESKLLTLANQCQVNIEEIEAKLRQINNEKSYFNTKHTVDDIAFAAYMIGRKDQAFAIYINLLGVELVQEMLKRACTKLGIQQMKLN